MKKRPQPGTDNARHPEVQKLIQDAQSLLKQLGEDPANTPASTADEALLFCYRLRDEYHIVRSSSRYFRGPAFSFLNGLLYQLESSPDETMRSMEWRSMLENLLKDLVSGSIVVERNSDLPSQS